ncbi:MAG TPA: hypothetical protein VKE73_08450 [Myxococcota bacterium]|nr:hypothetical protein [Myxococcota bacterium]
MDSKRGRSFLAAFAMMAIAAGAGSAQQAQRPAQIPNAQVAKPTQVHVMVVVHHVSKHPGPPGPVDPAAAKLERRLSQDFSYKSARVMQTEEMVLALNQTGSMTLPTGRILKVKPRKLGKRGLLMSVEIEGTLRTNLRVPNHHQVVIGAQHYQDGKLVVTLEPEYEVSSTAEVAPGGAPASSSGANLPKNSVSP